MPTSLSLSLSLSNCCDLGTHPPPPLAPIYIYVNALVIPYLQERGRVNATTPVRTVQQEEEEVMPRATYSAMNNAGFLLAAALLMASALCSGAARELDTELKRSSGNAHAKGEEEPLFPDGGNFYGTIPGWIGGGGGGKGLPGFPGGGGWGNMGGGWGAGYGGPGGGYARGGVVRPTVVCRERGPCYKKKLTCPAKCFTSYSHSGKHGGGGGGGGGCTIDCTKRCVAYC